MRAQQRASAAAWLATLLIIAGASDAAGSLIIPQPSGSPLVVRSLGPPIPYPRGPSPGPASAAPAKAAGPPGKPKPYPTSTPAAAPGAGKKAGAMGADPGDAAVIKALQSGVPQQMLVVFAKDPNADNAAIKARVLSPGAAPYKAGNRVAQDYSMLSISLVTVPDIKAYNALVNDPNVQSVQPNRQAYLMQPAPAQPIGGAAGRTAVAKPGAAAPTAPSGGGTASARNPAAKMTGSFVLGRD